MIVPIANNEHLTENNFWYIFLIVMYLFFIPTNRKIICRRLSNDRLILIHGKFAQLSKKNSVLSTYT